MLKDRAITLGLAGLAAVATAGWMRQPQALSPIPMNHFVAPDQIAGVGLTPVPASTVSTPFTVQSGVYRQAGVPMATARRTSPPPAARAEASRQRHAEPELQERRAIVDRSEQIDVVREPIVKKRSTKQSAAIVAGGAAAGAAIGGLAGGGKGAAIGALSGGAAGLVYDRMTHKKTVPADEATATRSRSVDISDDRREGRSTLERAAIIGGGAAAGAAIGGAAAGGKGAAIGALGGGAAGVIYDQMTKNR
jgi:hypothetical protein